MDLKTSRILGAAVLVVILALIVYSTLCVFVVQPIGAVPEGKTLIITRLNTLNFIDSADAWCERNTGSVNLLCRGIFMGTILQKTTVIARLPYSETLYYISTGGKAYDR